MIRKLLFALGGTLAVSTQVFAEDEYPRLGTYAISSPKDYYTAEYQKQLAKVHVSIINTYPGWDVAYKTSLDTVAKNVKAMNPNAKVFQYVLGESLQIPSNPAVAEYEQKVNSANWWVYQQGLSTSKVLSDYGKGYYVLNISPYSKKDSSGMNFPLWFADYANKKFGAPNPTLDGIFTDNVFWKPRRDGDWNLDGKIDSQNDPVVQGWYRAGYRQYVDALRKAMPNKLFLANAADWGSPASVTPEYKGAFNGGVMEHILGRAQSLENVSWKAMMDIYRKTMANFAAPKLGLFVHDAQSTSDYKEMRYGLTSCLMDDGYYAYNNDGDQRYYGVVWFDEFGAKLGKAMSKPQTAAWQSGVYRRDFEKGIALVNPRGNGTRTVTLEGDFVKIKGTQDPKVNNGATVRTVTLLERDGIILLRAKPIRKPAPPANLTPTNN